MGLPPSLSGAAHLRATELLSVPVMSGVPGLPGTAAGSQREKLLVYNMYTEQIVTQKVPVFHFLS